MLIDAEAHIDQRAIREPQDHDQNNDEEREKEKKDKQGGLTKFNEI